MSNEGRRVIRSVTEWQELISGYRASGLSRREFLIKAGVSRSACEKRLRKLYPPASRGGGRFIELGGAPRIE